MKIVSWNVNSVNVRKPLLKKLIEEFSPEVICLQETKTDNNSFPTNFFEKKNYKCCLNGMRSYNGVAIISKEQPKEFFVMIIVKKMMPDILKLKLVDIKYIRFMFLLEVMNPMQLQIKNFSIS